MKIQRTERLWIHTHFATDCEYLPADRAREIRKGMARVLENERIVFGIHFASSPEEKGVRIVLECLPLPETLARIEHELAKLVAPIPSRPRQTKVEIEPPRRRSR